MSEPVAKERALSDALSSLDSVVVAYSGGVDSAYLAFIASRTLGDRAFAVTADSPSYPERHRALAIRIAKDFGLHHEIIRTRELDNPEYRANPANRCYFCKHELYTHLSRIAAERRAVVVDGNNADDRGDSARASGVGSSASKPSTSESQKDEIRALSRRAGLPTWDGRPPRACRRGFRITSHRRLRTIERADRRCALGFRIPRPASRRTRARRIARDEMSRALGLRRSRSDRARAQSRRLSLRHARLAGLPAGQLNEGLFLRPT
jgi:uncharacterized protein